MRPRSSNGARDFYSIAETHLLDRHCYCAAYVSLGILYKTGDLRGILIDLDIMS